MRYKLITMKKELEIKKIATLFYMEYDKNYQFQGEQHDFWELIYCDHGEVIAGGDGKEYVIQRGMIVFHKPGEFHTLSANKKVSPNIIVISFVCTNPIMQEFENKVLALTDVEQKMLAKIVSESNNAFEIEQERSVIHLLPKEGTLAFGGQQYIQNLLEIFLIELIRRQKFMPQAAVQKSRITKINVDTMYADVAEAILAYFEVHLTEMISADTLCSQFSMSKSYIEYIFKQQTGMGMMEKFSHMKIAKAKELLRNEDYNITQISDYLGYSSVHYFSRRFKNIVGMPPSEYASSIKIKLQLIK